MTSVSMDVVTDPSPVNTESAGVEDAESSQGGKPAQPEPGKDLTAEEEALLSRTSISPCACDRANLNGFACSGYGYPASFAQNIDKGGMVCTAQQSQGL